MEGFNFEEFNAVGGRIIPTINLNTNGFVISAGFTKKYENISKSAGVKLYYDRDKNAIGFKFLQEKEEGMLRIKISSSQHGGFTNAKAFFIKFGIEPKKYQGRYTPEEVQTHQGQMFVIRLKETTE